MSTRSFRNMRGASGVVFLFVFAALLFVLSGSPNRASAAGPEPTATPHAMGQMRDRLAPPEMPAHPAQADLGAEVYYKVCMACHGDQGQGLTDEFRALLGPQDENCWQSKCHAANHPPGGFVFPKVVPPVVAPEMAARFPTALALHDFIKANMPYNKPGDLKEDEYWQLTAFLVRANKGGPLPATLDARTAAAVTLTPAAPGVAPWLIAAAIAGVGLVGLGGWWALRRSRAAHGE